MQVEWKSAFAAARRAWRTGSRRGIAAARRQVGRISSSLDGRPLSFQLRLLALATAIPLLLLALVMFNQMERQERESIRQGLLTSARTLAGLVDNEIETHAAVAFTLAQSPALQTGDLTAFREEVTRALAFVPGSWLTVSDPAGRLLLYSPSPIEVPLPPHAAPEILARGFATGRFQVSDLIQGSASRRLTVLVEVPVFRDGKPLYSMSIAVPPESFLRLLQKRFSHGHVVAIIDRQAKFVARLPDHAARVGTLAAEGWRAAIARTPEGWSQNVSVEGDWILTGHTQTSHGWTVGVAQLEANLWKPLNALLWWMASAGGLLVLSSLGLAWWLSARASRSMRAVANAARGVGDGSPLPPLEPAFAEARIIAESLSDASEELHKRGEQLARINSNLEDEVAARTRELVAEMKRREDTEAALRQSQKMEAIGRLTGGVAHDFNNMLTIVLGNLDTLQRRLRSRDTADAATLTKPVEAALHGARNAAKLTHRLLAFARQQPLSPTPIDLRALVAGMADMLSRTVGETIEIETVSGAGLWPTLADASQLENTLLNLVINARDAMPSGGRITIETSNAYLDEQYAGGVGDIAPGQYVLLSVSDTGTGIPADKLDKVFEPFFTTKPPGEGTGLGLAMIHGFVKQSGGHIRLYSEVGHGTAIKIYLPRLASGAQAATAGSQQAAQVVSSARYGETILLVEDDDGVREYATSALEELGYRVLPSSDAESALRQLATSDRVDLLFTDVVLKGSINGRRLAEEVARQRPNLPVLFTTGYTRNAIVHHGRLDAGVELLSKPYTSRELGDMIRRLIDRKAHEAPE